MKTKLNRTRIFRTLQSPDIGWKSLSLILLGVLFSVIPIKAQMPDNIIDIASCASNPPAQEWTIQELPMNEELVSNYANLMVGDIDNDGVVDIIAKDVRNSRYLSFGLKIFHFDRDENQLQLRNQFTFLNNIGTDDRGSTAMFRHNGVGYIIIPGNDGYLYAYDIDGNELWQSSHPYRDTTTGSVCVGIADFNNDGIPEIYAGNKIFSYNGALLCEGGDNNIGEFSYSMPVLSTFAIDIDDDYKLELLAGTQIYDVNIAPGSTSGTMSLKTGWQLPDAEFSKIPSISDEWKDGQTMAADFDGDGRPEILVIKNIGRLEESRIVIFVWEPRANNQSRLVGHYATVHPPRSGEGRISTPMIANIDNTPNPEIVFVTNILLDPDNSDILDPDGNSIENMGMYALRYDGTRPMGDRIVEKWTLSHSDRSGATGAVMFDFNQDGIAEIVYRDENTLRIIDGSGTEAVAINTFDNVRSSTGREYPIIADIDDDGQAEIIVTGWDTSFPPSGTAETYNGHNGHIRVFKSGSSASPWAPARKVWNQYMYNAVNINEDLTVPRYQFKPATIFPGLNGILGDADDIQPFNNLLQQQTTLNTNGTPLWEAAGARITDVSIFEYDAATDSMKVTVNVNNDGAMALLSPLHITAYHNGVGSALKHTYQHDRAIYPGETATITFGIPNFKNSSWASSSNIAVRINDSGNGQSHQQVCSTTDRDVNTTQFIMAAPDYAETIGNTSVTTTSVIANDNLLPGCNTPVITVAPKHGMAELIGNQIKYTPNTNYAGRDTLTYTVSCTSSNGSIIKASAPVYINVLFTTVDITVFLRGPLQSSGLMTNYIQEPVSGSSMFTSPSLPTTAPASFGVSANCPDINNSAVVGKIVDWVKVEIRKVSDRSLVEAKALLLRTNGKIVDVDGSIPGFLPQTEAVYLVVRSRNHLSAVSNAIPTFTAPVTYDFSTSLDKAHRNLPTNPDPVIKAYTSLNIWSMWAGDIDRNEIINHTDRTFGQNAGGSQGDYFDADLDMNGVINHTDNTILQYSVGFAVYSPLMSW